MEVDRRLLSAALARARLARPCFRNASHTAPVAAPRVSSGVDRDRAPRHARGRAVRGERQAERRVGAVHDRHRRSAAIAARRRRDPGHCSVRSHARTHLAGLRRRRARHDAAGLRRRGAHEAEVPGRRGTFFHRLPGGRRHVSTGQARTTQTVATHSGRISQHSAAPPGRASQPTPPHAPQRAAQQTPLLPVEMTCCMRSGSLNHDGSNRHTWPRSRRCSRR